MVADIYIYIYIDMHTSYCMYVCMRICMYHRHAYPPPCRRHMLRVTGYRRSPGFLRFKCSAEAYKFYEEGLEVGGWVGVPTPIPGMFLRDPPQPSLRLLAWILPPWATKNPSKFLSKNQPGFSLIFSSILAPIWPPILTKIRPKI